jgi:hypothetical protein
MAHQQKSEFFYSIFARSLHLSEVVKNTLTGAEGSLKVSLNEIFFALFFFAPIKHI